jgi:hypothetical protein
MQSVITALIAAMASGQTVYASDIRSMNSSVYDLWRTHAHTVTDRQGIDTYGNLTVYGSGGTSIVNTASNLALGAVTTPSGIAADQVITAADINVMINMVNSMQSHTHTITDSIGAIYSSPNINFYFNGSPNLISGTDSDGTTGGDYANITFKTDGTLFPEARGTYYYGAVQANNWMTNSPVDALTATGYQIKAHMVSADLGYCHWGAGTFDAWLNLGVSNLVWSWVQNNAGDYGQAVVQFQIRDINTLTILVDTHVTFQTGFIAPLSHCCFPADSFVLMDDGKWKKIQDVKAGDVAMGMGKPVMINSVEKPRLGERRMMQFGDKSLAWSEEHAMWTRDNAGSQWWWSANADMWRAEVSVGVMGGLKDNSTMRSGTNVSDWAHLDGWKANTVTTIPADATTPLYLPRTGGSPIIVNGYVVGAGVDETGFEYSKLDWDAVRAMLPVVDPLPTA